MSLEADELARYPEVDRLLQELLRSVQAILGEQFVGMYLYGSLAIGGFDPRTSDIDFLVVTSVEPSPEVAAALGEMHVSLLADGSPWAQELEGVYIPRSDIRRHDPHQAPHLQLERGSRELVTDKSYCDWIIHRRVLREQGAALAGPPAHELIDPVSTSELRQALQELIAEWWAPMIDDTSRLEHLGYRCYAVQTMCRVLYTLKFDTIVPKTAAAQWAKAELDSRWSPLIDWSFQWPRVEQLGTLEQTCELIRLVSEYCKSTQKLQGTDWDSRSGSS